MGNQNVETGKGQSQEKNIQNPGQNPNVKNPQQGQNQGRQQQQQQNPRQDTDAQRMGTPNDEAEEEVSEKEDLYGDRQDQGGMNRPEKH